MLQVGGTLRLGRLYIRRAADDDLLRRLRAGELCHVLAPRQIGKSSLRARTAATLRREGAHCAEVDLAVLGTEGVERGDWLYALACEIASGLEVDEPTPWRDTGAPLHQWAEWLGGVVRGSEGQVVIFLDEIDTLLALPFSSDDLFSSLRALHNRRAVDPAWERVVFCLVGVASPWGLMRHPWRSPFNVGESVVLEDFTWEEAKGFVASLPGGPAVSLVALAAVYGWTDGHPFLTQKVCAALIHSEGGDVLDSNSVDRVVRELFLEPSPTPDPGLLAAGRALLDAGAGAAEMLQLYRRALEGVEIRFDERDHVHSGLVITGLMARRGALLRLRNRIIAQRFGLDWVAEHHGKRELGSRAYSWVRGGRREEDLLRGETLRDLLVWAATSPELTVEESEFVLRSEATSLRRTLRRRLGWALVALLVVGLVAVGLGAWGRQKAWEEELSAAVVQALSAPSLAAQPGRQPQALTEALAALGPQIDGGPLPGAVWGLGLTMDAVRGGVVGTVDGAASMRWCRSGGARWRFVAVDAVGRGLAFDPVLRTSQTIPLVADGGASLECGVAAPVSSTYPSVVTASSPDGTATAHANRDDSGTLWLGGRSLVGHTDAVSALAFSADGRQLVSAADDDTLRLWDVSTGAHLWTSLAQTFLAAVSFSPDGRWIGSVTEKGGVALFGTRGGPVLDELAATGPEPVYSLALHPSGREVAAGWRDGRVRRWRWAGDEWLPVPEQLPSGCYAAYAASSGSLIVGGAHEAWVDDGRSHGPFVGRINIHGTPISPDGTQVLTLVGPRVVNTDAGCGTGGSTPELDAHPPEAWLWDVATGGHVVLGGHHAALWSAVFSGDGRVATLDEGGEVRLWRTADGALLRVLSAHRDLVNNVLFDGPAVFTLGYDDHVRRWEEGVVTTDLFVHGDPLAAVRVGADLLTATRNRNVVAWRGTEPIGRFEGPTGALRSIAVAPDGGRVLGTGADGTLWVWDRRTTRPMMRFQAHDRNAAFARFSPDGRWIVSGGGDGAVRIFPGDVSTLVEEARRWLGDAGAGGLKDPETSAPAL